MASVWVYMRSGQPTWARPSLPLPNIQIFGYERGIHLIKGKSKKLIEKLNPLDWDLICSNVSPEYVGPLNKNPVSKSMNNVRHRKKGRVIATRSQKGSRTQLVLISNMARKRRTRKMTTTLCFRSESRLNMYA